MKENDLNVSEHGTFFSLGEHLSVSTPLGLLVAPHHSHLDYLLRKRERERKNISLGHLVESAPLRHFAPDSQTVRRLESCKWRAGQTSDFVLSEIQAIARGTTGIATTGFVKRQ